MSSSKETPPSLWLLRCLHHHCVSISLQGYCAPRRFGGTPADRTIQFMYSILSIIQLLSWMIIFQCLSICLSSLTSPSLPASYPITSVGIATETALHLLGILYWGAESWSFMLHTLIAFMEEKALGKASQQSLVTSFSFACFLIFLRDIFVTFLKIHPFSFTDDIILCSWNECHPEGLSCIFCCK